MNTTKTFGWPDGWLKRFALVLVTIVLAGSMFGLAGCSGGEQQSKPEANNSNSSDNTNKDDNANSGDNGGAGQGKKKAQITMNDGGIIDLELDGDVAPITTDNFIKLASAGFYDGLTFHRVISGFMIQGGDPLGTGMGGSEQKIKGEFSANGVNNTISHQRGVISMGRVGNDMNSASSQFFICHADYASLDGQYAAFGRVSAGMDVVDRIAAVQTDAADKPLEDVIIKSIRVVE